MVFQVYLIGTEQNLIQIALGFFFFLTQICTA